MCKCVNNDPVACKAERYGYSVEEYEDMCQCVCHLIIDRVIPMNKEFESWWTVNKFSLMENDDVGVREIALAAYMAGMQAKKQTLQGTCFYCDEEKEPSKEIICQSCVDLLCNINST